jgi:hypothetical protein
LLNSFDIFYGFFSIGSPENYNSIDFGLKISDILAKDFDDFMVGSFEYIIGSILLVGRDKLRLEGRLHGFKFLKIRFELVQQRGFQNLSPFAGFIEIQI